MTNEAPKERLMLAVFLVADGSIRLEGEAIQDKVLSYGLLETARDLIHEAHIKAQQSRLVKPNGGQMLNWLRNK